MAQHRGDRSCGPPGDIPGVILGSSEATFLHARYLSKGDDLPWINWKEMVLIAAEAAGGQGAIDKVNALRLALTASQSRNRCGYPPAG